MRRILTGLLIGSLAVGWATGAWSADIAPTAKVPAASMFRTSALTGLDVRNQEGEKLGAMNDLVVDVRNGNISYATVSVGGLLGLGARMFAVPFRELKFDHGTNEMFFVLDIAKQKFEAAPGFDNSTWPNFADPNWSERIDKYYREAHAKEQARRTSTGNTVE